MDGIQMEPIGKYKADRNGSAKAAAWRNMVDQDLDDVAFLADTDKAREARELREAPVAVCSQRRALCLAALVFSAMFATALLVVYATPQADCPCAGDNPLVPGSPPTGSDASNAAANKERIATNGAVFPWRGARLPTFVIPKHYSLWLHPNLTTGELRGEVSIDFKVDRDTSYVVLNVRDMNVTERALFKGGGTLGPKVVRTLDYLPAEQTYIEFKEKLRRKYNYTLSLRFITKLERNEKQRGFFMTGTHKHRCAVSRFWLTHARAAFPCLDEPHLRATFKLTIVRDRFHVSLTNMPIMATEEAGFYLGHRLLQDEFAQSPPMPPHMMSMAVCRLQRRAAPPLPTEPTVNDTDVSDVTTVETDTTDVMDENIVLPPPEISLYSDQQVILDEAGPLLEWVQKTIQHFSFELNTSYPLPKFDIVVVEGGSQYAEGWGLITLPPAMLTDTKTIARLLAQQWFGGLVSPRWWSSQWLMEALTSVLAEKAPAYGDVTAERQLDALLLDHVLPALRLDSSNTVRAVASPRLERADIEAASDELSLHKGAAIVSMAIEAAGEAAGRAALARLLRDHRAASADARDLWRALERESNTSASLAWDGWCELAGYPLLGTVTVGGDVQIRQVRFVMQAPPPPQNEPSLVEFVTTLDLRRDLNNVFYEPENFTDTEEDINATTTTTPAPTTKKTPRPTPAQPDPKWIVPLTFVVGPLKEEDTRIVKNSTEPLHNTTWYDVGNDTKPVMTSRWAQNVTHLIWMNDTEMTIPDLGKHKWVRYNVGARGLYRVAPDDRYLDDAETDTEAILRAAAMYESGAPAERALLLDDAFVLARARRVPASRAIAAASRLTTETHWAPWRVVLSHLSWWREQLRLGGAGPRVAALLRELHPRQLPLYTAAEMDTGGLNEDQLPPHHRDRAPWRVVLSHLSWWRELHPRQLPLYTAAEMETGGLNEDQLWLSGALLTAGVEWGNPTVTKQATKLFDAWLISNQTIPDIYQEAAFTAGVREHGERAWRACWRALVTSYAAPRPLYNHKALLNALGSSSDDWLYNKFAVVVMSSEARRARDWPDWATSLCASACRWRGAAGALRVCRGDHLPPSALQAAARCIHLADDYYTFKAAFGSLPGGPEALDIIALNANWMERADTDIARYFAALDRAQ